MADVPTVQQSGSMTSPPASRCSTETDEDAAGDQAAADPPLPCAGGHFPPAAERAFDHDERYRFLLDATLLLAATLDYRAELEQIARLAVPTLADWCAIDLIEDDGLIHRLVAVHRDPSNAEAIARLQRCYPLLRLTDTHTITRVLASGQSWFDPAVDQVRLAREARDSEHLTLLRTLGYHAEIVVPLLARGRALGTLTLVLASAARQYSHADLELAEDLARRFGLAIENARLYQRAQEELARRRQAEEERRAFVDAVAHDVKGPLGVVKGQVQLMRRRLRRGDSLDPAVLDSGLARIEEAAARTTSLIDEMLDAAHMQAGIPLDLRLSETDLVAVVRLSVDQMRHGSVSHEIVVETRTPSLVGEWDRSRLERVVGNLLVNAIKYSPPGSEVTVTLDRVETAGRVWAELRVRDRGIGIPAADLPHIFERFRRGSNVNGRFAGTGIGLAGVRQIVEQHAGSIAVASVEGSGSVFTIRLPLGESDCAAAR